MANIKFNRIFAGNNQIVVELDEAGATAIGSNTEVTLNHPNYKGTYKVLQITPPNSAFAYNERGHAGFNTDAYFLYLTTPFVTPKSDPKYKALGVRWTVNDTRLSGAPGIGYEGADAWGAEDRNDGEIVMKSTGQSYTDGSQSMGGSLEEKYSNIPDEPTTTAWYKNKWVWIGSITGLVVLGIGAFFLVKSLKGKGKKEKK